MSAEVWAAVPGAAYEVSDLGRVRRAAGGKGAVAGKVLAPQDNGRGYMQVGLHGRMVLVHRLVLRAFVGPRPAGAQANHKDGVRAHNAATNLEWCTASENLQHSYDTLGRAPCSGAANGNARLNPVAVRVIRYLRSRGVPAARLARAHGISRVQVGRIERRQQWQEVPT